MIQITLSTPLYTGLTVFKFILNNNFQVISCSLVFFFLQAKSLKIVMVKIYTAEHDEHKIIHVIHTKTRLSFIQKLIGGTADLTKCEKFMTPCNSLVHE